MPKSILGFIQEGVSLPLTKIAAGYSPQGLIAAQLFPRVEHYMASGKIPIWGKDAFKVHDTKRAIGAKSNRYPLDPGSWATLNCEEHDVAIPLDHRELNKIVNLPSVEGPLFNVQNRARRAAQGKIAMTHESAVATICQDTSNFPTGHHTTLTAEWDDAAGSPATTLETGREAIRDAIGRYPNTLVLGAESYKIAKDHDDYKDFLASTERKFVSADVIAAKHELDNVWIGMSQAMAADGTLFDLWADMALLCYMPKGVTPDLDEPAFGYTVSPMGTPQAGVNKYPYVDLFVEEGGKIVNVRCTDNFAPLMLMPAAGYLIKNTKTD